jgi:hypothetical protein
LKQFPLVYDKFVREQKEEEGEQNSRTEEELKSL